MALQEMPSTREFLSDQITVKCRPQDRERWKLAFCSGEDTMQRTIRRILNREADKVLGEKNGGG